MPTADDVVWRLAEMIEKTGWAAQAVFPAAESDGVGWTYTIGLHATTGQPEVIVFGLPPNLAHSALTVLANRALAGEDLAVGRAYHDVLAGTAGKVVVELAPVDPAFAGPQYSYFNVGRLMWGGEAPPFVQLLWPDARGRLPGEKAFDAAMVLRQPLLSSRARSAHEISTTEGPRDS